MPSSTTRPCGLCGLGAVLVGLRTAQVLNNRRGAPGEGRLGQLPRHEAFELQNIADRVTLPQPQTPAGAQCPPPCLSFVQTQARRREH